ncbi:unnamed protein product [Agarophyton chilense]|eukprot:gb/GEZJ01000187.1/.p2 GENE.gb/GEZJ01000187.1/~~gb/GEZJ01000187.1/.p2  ORF type:complete len:1437 (-),score=216.31 gb/GEZJ01000187.1/:19365-23675(-)
MPRAALKRSKGGFDPHAFEFTGEEASQADKAAKGRPAFRRQKLSVLSTLPDSQTQLTTLARKPVVSFKNAEDSEQKLDTENGGNSNSTIRNAQNSIDVSKPETKGAKGGRKKPGSMTKRNQVKRKPALECTISSTVKREVTPEPRAIGSQSASQNGSECSSALRRSDRKRFRTTKALQAYEESQEKYRTPKRRRNSQDLHHNVEEQRNEATACVLIRSKSSIKGAKDPLLKDVTSHKSISREDNCSFHHETWRDVDAHSHNEAKDTGASENPSEKESDILPRNMSNTTTRASSAPKKMSDSRNEDPCASRPQSMSSGHPCSVIGNYELDKGQETESRRPYFGANPMVVQRRDEHASEQRLLLLGGSGPYLPDSGISDQNRKEESRNSTDFLLQEREFQGNQKHSEDTAPCMDSEHRSGNDTLENDQDSNTAALRTCIDILEKDQGSNMISSSFTVGQPENDRLTCTPDPKVIGDTEKERILADDVQVKQSVASSVDQVPLDCTQLLNTALEPTARDEQSGCTNVPQLNPVSELRILPKMDHGEYTGDSFASSDCNANVKDSLSPIVVPQGESGTMTEARISKPSITESRIARGDKELQKWGASGMQECEVEQAQRSPGRKEPADTENCDSVRLPYQMRSSRSCSEITRESPKDTKISAAKDGKGTDGVKTSINTPTKLIEIDSKLQYTGSTEKPQSEKSSEEIYKNYVREANNGAPFESTSDAKRLSCEPPLMGDVVERCKSFGRTLLGKRGRENEDWNTVPFETACREESKSAQDTLPVEQDFSKSKQTFSKRVRFIEPEKSFPSKINRKGISDIMKMRLRKAKCKQLTPFAGRSVTVMTVRGPGPNEKERRVFLDELQYILDGIFKPSGKAEQKSPQLESQLISKTLISLTQLLTKKSREVKSSVEDENGSALVQILSTQPSLFRSIVSQLCGVFGKSRSIDAMLAVVFVLIFRATPKLLLIDATELDVLLNSFFRSSAAAFKADELEHSNRVSAAKGGAGTEAKKRRGRLAKRFEESKVESSVLSALNKIVKEVGVVEEGFSGFKNEAVAASHLIGTALSLVMCFHENLRCLMQENRRLDKVVAVLYSCEKLLVRKPDSGTEEKKLHFVSAGASTPWIVLGASLKVLEFAILDKMCQTRTARESRICAIVVDVIRSVECLREGMFGSEWILSAALRVAINLCHGFREASCQFVKQKGHELALNWVAKECNVAGLLSGGFDDLCKDGIEQSFDVRVLCLALLATIVDQEQDVCDQFHTMNVVGFEHRNAGGLEIATQILEAAEAILEASYRSEKTKDAEECERRRPPDLFAQAKHTERAELILESKITIGYASLLIGALVQKNVKNRELAEKLVPSNNLLGVAAVLTGFLEFHHEVGIISGSMDRMYVRIIDSLVKPFQNGQRMDEAMKTCNQADRGSSGEEEDVPKAGETGCT